MHATFNGIHLSRVISHKICGSLETVRFLDGSEEIESELRIGAPVVLYLRNPPIKGVIARFQRDEYEGYEVTVDTIDFTLNTPSPVSVCELMLSQSFKRSFLSSSSRSMRLILRAPRSIKYSITRLT